MLGAVAGWWPEPWGKIYNDGSTISMQHAGCCRHGSPPVKPHDEASQQGLLVPELLLPGLLPGLPCFLFGALFRELQGRKLGLVQQENEGESPKAASRKGCRN